MLQVIESDTSRNRKRYQQASFTSYKTFLTAKQNIVGMTVAPNFCFPSSPKESDAARQIDYMSYLDFMAGEVIFGQMSLNSLLTAH